MSFKEDIARSFREGNLLTKLLYVNAGVFVVVSLVHIIVSLFLLSWDLYPYLSMPGYLLSFLVKPWTIITYMFLHIDIIHFLLNMLMLYWMGQLFLYFFSQKQLLGLYLLGGLFGGLFYLLAYNLIPYYASMAIGSHLMGASASIMALIVAAAVWNPRYPIRLVLVGEVKLGVIALIYVGLSLLGIVSSNAGGELAHLGGALAGYLFARSMKNGKDMTAWISKIMDSLVNVGSSIGKRKSTIKVVKTSEAETASPDMDMAYNERQNRQNEDIDRILDKIKRSGYDSLSDDERRQLFSRKK